MALITVFLRLFLNLRESYKQGSAIISLTFVLYVIYLVLISVTASAESDIQDLNQRSIHPTLGWIILFTLPLIALIPDFLATILCKRYKARYLDTLYQVNLKHEIEKKAKLSIRDSRRSNSSMYVDCLSSTPKKT